jgi:ribulose-phosphate 3-epimerase
MKPYIVPAIITKSQDELNEMLDKVKGKVKRVMLDVMDGKFVPNTSLEFEFTIPATSDFEYEAHLMVNQPLEWIEKNGNKVDTVIMQVETLDNIGKAISFVKERGLGVVLALNPETELDLVLPVLTELDGILLLTVNPGQYGASFVPMAINKIKHLRNIDKTIPIEVDGSMNPKTIKLAKEAGASIFASGSYIMKSKSPENAIKKLEEALK